MKRLMLHHRLLTFIGVSVLALLGVVFLSASAQEVSAQQINQDTPVSSRTITVSGTGQALGAPDIAYIQLGTDQSNSDPAAAFQSANDVMNAVRDAVTGLGVAASDIQTTTFNIWVQDNTDSSGNPTGERTYHAQDIVTITVRDVTKTGDVISAAIGAGANNINNLSFGIADPTELANQARAMAIADAQSRAQQIASTLGVTVGPVMTVNESVSSDGQPQPMAMAYAASAGGGAPVNQGQLTVSVQVTITFAIGS